MNTGSTMLEVAGARALAASGGPHTGGPHTLSLSISPYKVISSAHRSSTAVKVINLSGGTVTVRSSAIEIGKQGTSCAMHQAPSWLHVTPAHFTLAKGHYEITHVIVAAPASATGSYDLAAVYRASPAAHTGINVSGAAGARVLLSLGGKGTAHACTTAATAPAPSSGGLPVVAMGLGSLGLALALGAALVARRLRHKAAQARMYGYTRTRPGGGGAHRAR